MSHFDTDKFDSHIQQQLDGHEMPYDAAAWDALQRHLPPQAPAVPAGSGHRWLKALAVAGGIAAAGAGWYLTAQQDAPGQATLPSAVAPETHVAEEKAAPTGLNRDDAPAAISATAHGNTAVHQAASPRPTLAAPASEQTAQTTAQEKQAAAKPAAPAAQGQEPRQETPSLPANPPAQGGKEPPHQEGSVKDVRLAIKTVSHIACAGETVRLEAQANVSGLSYTWELSNGQTAKGRAASLTSVEAGLLEAVLTATDGKQTWTASSQLTVRPAPVPKMEAAQPFPAIPYHRLSAPLAEGETCRWQFSDGRLASGPAAHHLFRERGAASVTLTVTDREGCTATEQLGLPALSEDFLLLAEDAFTPNGDGINDDFLPKALLPLGCAFEMTVKDQRGRVVYQTRSTENPWNGRMMNAGAMMDPGFYSWSVALLDDFAAKPVFHGSVKLILLN